MTPRRRFAVAGWCLLAAVVVYVMTLVAIQAGVVRWPLNWVALGLLGLALVAAIVFVALGLVGLARRSPSPRPPVIPMGWHDDPYDPGLLRYHDGAQWTDRTAAKS